MSLDREVRGEIEVLTPRKNLQGGGETKELQQVAQEIFARGVPRIVVDLGRISYMNSAGLGALVGLHSGCRSRQGWLRIARVSARIKDLFLVTKLTLVFDSYDSVEEAIEGVNQADA
jgi:anti-sigma B factor antagonist